MKKNIVFNIIFILALFKCSFIFAQETNTEATNNETKIESTDSLEDELFGGDDEMLLTQEETKSENLKKTTLKGNLDTVSLVLETAKLRFGGSLNSGLNLNYSWKDPYSKKEDFKKYFKDSCNSSLLTKLGASLFFDARPTKNSKIYGKFLFGFPFEKTLTGSIANAEKIGNSLSPMLSPILQLIKVETPGVPNFKIHELYTDFSAKDIVFFRFGKHTVKWGTGIFYSPADVLNISRIDPQDINAAREGAVSFRAHVIIPKTQHNIWMYLLPDTKKFKPEHTAVAAKADLVFGSWEWGIGAWYRYEKAPKLMTTLSGSIAGKVSIFAEGVFAWGSDYTYNKPDLNFTSYEVKDKVFFQATFGGMYTIEESKTTFLLQYYYNGFGYKSPGKLSNSVQNVLENEIASRLATAGSAFKNLILMGQQPGQHYIAFTISQNKLGTDKLSLRLFQQFSISELEGISKLTLNWKIYKFASMNIGPMFIYPLSKDSYSKGSISFNLGFNLGGGKF